MSFDDNLAYGKQAEVAVSEQLKTRGWFVVPSYDYTGGENKSPKMHGINSAYVIPDLDVAKDGDRRWIEVKHYRQVAYFRKNKQWRHGIKKRHYLHYLKVQQITGAPVYLVICEDWKTGDCYEGKELPAPQILTIRLDKLVYDPCLCAECNKGRQYLCKNKMLYFDRHLLTPIFTTQTGE